MSARSRILLALVATPFLLGACATEQAQHRDWSTYEGPGAEYFKEPVVEFWDADDPAEPTNRVVTDVVHGGAEYVVAPLAWVWRTITPKGLRSGLTNVGKNLFYPVRLVSNSIQGNWDRVATESERFAINTTLGILGWNDAAKERGTKAPPAQDMGLAFRHHGWKETAYTAVPKATVRDSVGFVPDIFLDPLTYVPGASIGRAFNDASDEIPAYVNFTNTTYDPYRLERMARYLNRTLEENDGEWAAGVGGAVDTLQYVFLGVLDPEFPDRKRAETVELPSTGKEFHYNVWLQDHRAPVMFVIPGTGGHRDAGSTAALAEMAFEAGYHAVTISSSLNYDFIQTASTVKFAGFPLSDAHDTHVALTAVDGHLREEFGDVIGDRRAVMGISMGAFHALYMASWEEQAAREGLIPFDGYLALNPPVGLVQTAKGFDDYLDLPAKYFPGDTALQNQKIKALFRHVLNVAGSGDLQPGKPLPLNNVQAEFLIGVGFRMTLMDILDQAKANGYTDDILMTPRTNLDRSASYAEIRRYSFMQYLYAFLLPEQAALRPEISDDERGSRHLQWLADLRSIDLALKLNPRVRVHTNRNEILLRPSDQAFLRRTFGGRLTVHESGGHLGNLWEPKVRKELAREMHEIHAAD